MTPELETELRTTVASLRVKVSCQELLIMALLPELSDHQKHAFRERLADMHNADVASSRLVDQEQIESETMRWIRTMREALDE